MGKIFMVAGLGFGDEGKGTITEYLCHKHSAKMVVRYNGGSQAAHNVVVKAGNGWGYERHHTFSQFGCGTIQGIPTHLSRWVVVDPLNIFREAKHLLEVGVKDPLSLLTIEDKALIVTEYHIAANRLLELQKGEERHGSCGAGIGEARGYYLTCGEGSAVLAEDLKKPKVLAEKLRGLKSGYMKLLQSTHIRADLDSSEYREFTRLTTPVEEVAEKLVAAGKKLNVVTREFLGEFLAKNHTVVFEGAQGMLLDQNYGFFPHTTWTDITFSNACDLLDDARPSSLFERDVERIGVTRTFITRHGAGPLPTEKEEMSVLVEKDHNKTNPWQGNLRVGRLDLVLLRYAIRAIRGVDYIAMTHMDMAEDLAPGLDRFCVAYRGGDIPVVPNPGINEQERVNKRLSDPNLVMSYWPYNKNFKEVVGEMVGAPIKIVSRGPTLHHKTEV